MSFASPAAAGVAACGARSRLRHLLEDAALVGRVSAHRLDEVRDEVAATLELDVDVRPAGVRLVAQPDEAVVADHRQHDDEGDDAEDDPEPEHASPSLEALERAARARARRPYDGSPVRDEDASHREVEQGP